MRHSTAREPGERHRRLAARALDGQRQRASGGVPVGALEDAGLALHPAPVRFVDVVLRRREDVEDEAAVRGEEVADGGEGADPLSVVMEVEQGAERADDERDWTVDRRRRAGRRVSGRRFSATPASTARVAATASIPSDESMPMTSTPAWRDGDGDPAGADAELHDRAAGALRLVHVEVDVLADASAPRVVQARDRVVRNRAGSGAVADLRLRFAAQDVYGCVSVDTIAVGRRMVGPAAIGGWKEADDTFARWTRQPSNPRL